MFPHAAKSDPHSSDPCIFFLVFTVPTIQHSVLDCFSCSDTCPYLIVSCATCVRQRSCNFSKSKVNERQDYELEDERDKESERNRSEVTMYPPINVLIKHLIRNN